MSDLFQTVQPVDSQEKPSSRSCRILFAIEVAIGAIGIIFLAILMSLVWKYTCDDSFITLRYAQNLANGFGLNFNHGLPHIEGYSSALWTLLLAIPHLFGWSAVVFSKVAGSGFTLATLAIIAYSAAMMGTGVSFFKRTSAAL